MKIAVIGLGKLGACQALLFAEAGLEVMGIDIDPDALDALKRGETTNPERYLAEMLAQHGPSIDWRSDPADAAVADVVFCVVPTPSLPSGAYDPSALYSVAEQVANACDPDHDLVFCIVSTTTPGDAERLADNVSFPVVTSPEFIALGDVFAGMRRPDLLLIGETESWAGDKVLTCLRAIQPGRPDDAHADQIYKRTAPAICRMGLTEAEITKLAINAYVTMKVSYANTLGAICRGYDADPLVVARAVGADHRIGPAYLRPGGSYGGPCFPRDSKAFSKVASSVGVSAPLATASDVVNKTLVLDTADRILALHPSQVTVLGTAYKPGTDVTEQSFGVALVAMLTVEGVAVTTWDPLARCTEPDLDAAIAAADVVVVATPDRPDFVHPHVVDCWA